MSRSSGRCCAITGEKTQKGSAPAGVDGREELGRAAARGAIRARQTGPTVPTARLLLATESSSSGPELKAAPQGSQAQLGLSGKPEPGRDKLTGEPEKLGDGGHTRPSLGPSLCCCSSHRAKQHALGGALLVRCGRLLGRLRSITFSAAAGRGCCTAGRLASLCQLSCC